MWNAKYKPSMLGSLTTLYENITRAAQNGSDLGGVFKTHFNKLSDPASYFEPHLAKFVEQTVDSLPKNEEGLIDSKELVIKYIGNDPIMLAIYHTFRHNARGDIISEQTKHGNYCSLVPVIPSAFKRYANIPYSAWDPETLKYLITSNLYDAMTIPEIHASISDLEKWRIDALTPKKGGPVKPATTTYSIYPSKESPLYEYPMLVRHMLCQTWCAHPVNRNKYMILDPINWDKMPEPIVSADVTSNVLEGDGPWNLRWPAPKVEKQPWDI